MRALQALVICQAVLILAGLIWLVAVLAEGPKHRPADATPTVAPARLVIPAGFRLTEMAATADRVVLRLDSSDGRQTLLVFDPATGSNTTYPLSPASLSRP